MQKSDKPKDDTPQARARALIEQGSTVWDVANEYALEALVVRHDDLDCADEKIRAAAARDLLYAWSRLPPRPALPPEAGITPGSDEWKQRCKDAEQDAAVRAYFMSEGWTPPVPSKERN